MKRSKLVLLGMLALLLTLGLVLAGCPLETDNGSNSSNNTGGDNPGGDDPGGDNPGGGTKPDAPATVIATAESASSISVMWSPVDEAVSYKVYYASSASGAKKLAGTETDLSYTHTGLQADTVYYYYVTAVNDDGESGYSDSASATTLSSVETPTVPDAPTDVTAVGESASSISISWSPVTGAESYNVYFALDNTAAKNMVAISITETSYVHTGLPAEASYYYYVTAVNSTGESDYSSYSYATTRTAILAPPTGVSAVAQSSSSIRVTWDTVSGAVSYKVYYGIGSGTTKYVAAEDITGTSYTHTGLTGNVTYFYYITTVNSAGESPFSSSDSATTLPPVVVPTVPNAPTGVSATAQSSSSIRVTWNAVSGATSYKVYYEIGSSTTKYTATSYITGTSYTHTGLTASTTYYYYITAVNSVGESNYSAFDTAVTPSGGGGNPTVTKLATPTGLSATLGITGAFVQISFNEVSLAYSYELYRSTSATGTYTKITASGGSSGGKYVLTDSNPRTGTNYYKVKALPNTTYFPNMTASDLSNYVFVTK